MCIKKWNKEKNREDETTWASHLTMYEYCFGRKKKKSKADEITEDTKRNMKQERTAELI